MQSSSLLSLVGNLPEFPNGDTNLHPQQQCENDFPPFPTPSSPALDSFLDDRHSNWNEKGISM